MLSKKQNRKYALWVLKSSGYNYHNKITRSLKWMSPIQIYTNHAYKTQQWCYLITNTLYKPTYFILSHLSTQTYRSSTLIGVFHQLVLPLADSSHLRKFHGHDRNTSTCSGMYCFWRSCSAWQVAKFSNAVFWLGEW